MTAAARTLVERAEYLLDGATGATGATGNTARLAAFLARQAVEELIDDRCLELTGIDVAGGTMKSRLAVLKSLDESQARVLVGAWYELSGYCHRHAYELSPTISQVRGVVERITAADSGFVDGPPRDC